MSSTLNQQRYNVDQKSDMLIYDLIATGLVPQFLIRRGIRQMLKAKLQGFRLDNPEQIVQETRYFAEQLHSYPIAIETDRANTQHYEVPVAFFSNILGPAMKYSCCLFEEGDDLAAAEERMLALSCKRAEIVDGHSILDLGCDWGAMTLFCAQKFPQSQVTAVSNSRFQRQYIESKADQLGLTNVRVITCDINALSFPNDTFDRIISIEMFEHVKNYAVLLKNISSWLKAQGKLFVHIFTHAHYQYHFGQDSNDWLAKYFFSGGTMPSHQLLGCFDKDMKIVKDWKISGVHYQKTAESWLQNMNLHRQALMPILASTYGDQQVQRWWMYWRLFFLACSELWGYEHGREWGVSHYLFERRSDIPHSG